MIQSVIIFLLVVSVLAFFISKIAKYFLRKIETFEKKQIEKRNPYIEAQKFKDVNDELYKNYIDWLDKNGGDVPFEKVKFNQDVSADKKIEKLFK